jgi:competence protein ComEC
MLPVIVLSVAWLAGIFVQNWLQLPDVGLYIVGGGGVILAIVATLINRRFRFTPDFQPLPVSAALALTFFCLGALRLISAAPSTAPDSILHYIGQDVTVIGVVSGEPTEGLKTESFRLSVQQIKLEKEKRPLNVRGEIYVRAGAVNQPQRGDLLELTGPLLQPAELSGEDFPYRDWLARQGIFATLSYPKYKLLAAEQDFFLSRFFYSVNKQAADNIMSATPGQPGALVVSVVLGDKSQLDKETKASMDSAGFRPIVRDPKEFNTAGVMHILVVSGSNILILIQLTVGFGVRFTTRQRAFVFAIGVIIFYTLLVGFSPPVVRAALMGIFAVGGVLLGRQYSGIAGLATAAFLMTLWQPQYVMDIGFQLSFMATLGVLMFGLPLQKRFDRVPPFVQEGLLVSIAAQIMVTPLATYYFGGLSLVSLLTNLLVVPALVFVMVLGLSTAALGWLPVVGTAVGFVNGLFSNYILAVINFCAGLPLASVAIPKFSPVWLLVYYTGVFTLYWWFTTGRHNPQVRAVVESPFTLAGTTLACSGVWLFIFLV